MSRRRYSKGSDSDVVMLLILAAVFYWLWMSTLLIYLVGAILGLIMLKLGFKMLKAMKYRNSPLSKIDRMSGLEFEKVVVQLLKKRGYSKLRITEKYDYGVDIVAEKDGVKWGVQVKRNGEYVKANAVRQVVTALRKYNCNKSMVVTNSYFGRVAKELAESNDCKLIDRSVLTSWLNS